MKRFCVLLALLSFSFGVVAAQTIMLMTSRPIPDRPIELVALLKGSTPRVIAYEKNKPVGLVNNERKTVSRDALVVHGTWDRLPGLINVAVQSKVADLEDPMGPPDGRNSSLEFELTSDRDFDGVFAVLVAYETCDKLVLADSDVKVTGQDIGRLETGKTVHLKLPIPQLDRVNPRSPIYAAKPPTRRWALHIFSGGRQIRTSLGSAATDYILEISDLRNFELMHTERLKSGNHGLALFRGKPFEFTDSIKQRHAGHKYEASLKVSPGGRVTSVDIPGADDPELVESALAQLKTWLFLPPCQNGTIILGAATIPLEF